MNAIGEFVFEIMKNILRVPLVKDKYYEKYGISRNLLYNYIVMDNYVSFGRGGANGFKELILDNISNNNFKKQKLKKYLSSFLNDDEKKNIVSYEELIEIVISKFTDEKNSIQENLDIDLEEKKNYYAKRIKKFFLKLLDNIGNDSEDTCLYAEKILNSICKSILIFEKVIIKHKDYVRTLMSKKIIPKNIEIVIRNIDNTITILDNKNNNGYENELLESCMLNLKILVKWYLIEYLGDEMVNINEKNKNSDFKIVDIYTLMKMGWTIRDYVEEATRLSYETIDDLTEEHNGEIEEQIKIVSEQPENRRILLDSSNKIIGMWSFKPFYKEIFEKAKEGELFDSEITPSMMPTLIPGIYNIYFSNICLVKEYRRSYVFGKLFMSIIELIYEWSKQGIFIYEICAQAYSDSGKNLCKSAGLKFYKNHVDHGEIYCSKVKDLLNEPFCKNFKNLKILYQSLDYEELINQI